MTGMKKIFLNSSYKRAGYIHKSPCTKLFGTSNCKSLSALSSLASLGMCSAARLRTNLATFLRPAADARGAGGGARRGGGGGGTCAGSRGAALVSAALVTMGTL